MRRESFGKRLLSMLMALVLIAGLLPAAVFADDTVVLDAAIFCSDLHGSTSELSSVLSAIGTNIDASAIGFNGDTCLNEADLEKLVKEKLNDTSIEDVYSYASSHDGKDGGDIGTNWDYSGKCFENDNYIIYTIRETDMISDTGADEAFTTWYSGLTAAQKAKPIFILSHRPLHARRNDNDGAAGWYTAISAAANSSDIVFFWAHNHTGETSADTNAYYVPNDGTETITVQGGSTVGLNFTYMNAGYMNANGQNPARKPVATTVQITADSLIFQDYTTSGTYTNSSYSHNVTVERKFASKTVTEQTFYSDDTFAAVTATATGATLTKFTEDTAADALLSFWYGFDISLEGQVEDTDATVTLWLSPEEMSSNNVAVYYYNETTGAYELVSSSAYTISVDEEGVSYITIKDAALGKYIYGTPLTQIPDGAVLTGLTVVNNGATKYFKDEKSTEILPLDITGLVVTATYSNGTESVDKIIPWNNFDTSADGYSLTFDMTVLGDQDVVVTYTYGDVTLTGTYPIWIGNESFPVDDITVTVENPGTTGVTIDNVTDNVTAAVGGMLESGYTAYDIVLSYVDDKGLDGGTATVKMPAPAGANVVYYFNDTTGALEKMEDATFAGGYVTFTTNHFSIYVVGETSEEDEKTQTLGGTTTEKKTVYVLTSSISSGNSYLIVNGNSAGSYYALANNSGSVAATGVTVKTDSSIGTYIELDDATDELWTYGTTTSDRDTVYTFKNGSYYLYYTSTGSGTSATRTLTLTTSTPERSWSYSNNQLVIRSRYLTGGSSWSLSTTASNVYFYVPTEATITENTSTKYEVSASDIEHIYDNDANTEEIEALTYALLGNGEEKTFEGGVWTVKVVSDANGIIDTTNSTNETLYFTGNIGEATVRVYYQWDANGDGDVTDDDDYKVWTTITVTATNPYYTVDITHNSDGSGTTGTTSDYVSVTDTIMIKGETAISAGYDLWAKVYLNGTGDPVTVSSNSLSWISNNPSVATVDSDGNVTFTGNEGTAQITVYYEYTDNTGTKVKATDVVTFSVTVNPYIVPEDGTKDFPEYPNQGAIRFDKTATAVGNFSQTGIAQVELSMTGVPYGTSVKTDVVVMVDMTSSMEPNDITAAQLAVQELIETLVYDSENDVYDSNIQLFVSSFSSGTSTDNIIITDHLYNTTISSASELTAAKNVITDSTDGFRDDRHSTNGTHYGVALADVYATLTRDGHAENQFVVFVTDGVPTRYWYVDSSTSTGYTEVTGSNSDTASLAAGWFDDDGEVTSSFKTEYYTNLIKGMGIPVYTIGANLTSGSDAADLINHMSSNYSPDGKTSTGETKYSFTCTTSGGITDEVLEIFQGIGESIKEAATDVVVEDKIADEYTMNFSLPSGVNSTEAGMDAFYIQVVEYALDSTTHERSGDPTVLEKFLFNANGTITHTIGTDTCGDTCTHVTYTDGVVTAITGTYFTYTSDDTNGEILTWKADKLSTTELALQYFVYLENSAGSDADNQVAAGTYDTNEYATITYTNYLGNEVQQKFPVPSMTWKGAKVTYVFYLVNSQGQPVNRAGKVIPFAEAIYVTTPVTFDVTWNEETGSENILAKSLFATANVPSVYELYDTNAAYVIRVYQTENVDTNGVNGNYFQITGSDNKLIDSEMDSDTTVNNSTTKVFNTKAGTKYDYYGIYSSYDVGTKLTNGTDTITTTVKTDDIDYANTTVAFAVVWKPELVEDTVVIDFGLDVVIDVYTNDGLASGVTGVMTTAPDVAINTGYYATAVGSKEVDATDGTWTATVESLTSVRFHLNNMEFKAPASFFYESGVNYYTYDASGKASLITTNMYSSVTVIPATTVYYEDSYVTFTDSGSKDETYGTWTEEGTAISGTQDVDRPGVSQAMSDAYDANNLYGYDSAYDSMSTWSMGSAHKVTVKSGISGMASFSFYGTGFDVISMTDSTCGAIVVNVFDSSNALVKSLTVNNYYGYAYVDGEWVTVDSNDPNALYQVPVMKVEGLTYGKYTVKIVANYNSLADVASAGSYTFYLDAIRIYDPTGVASGSTTNNTVSGAYGADGEAFPSYTELRDMVLAAEALESDGTLEGVVFIDGATTTGAGNTASVSDYTNYGPNNELYLANGQAIAADLSAPTKDGYDVRIQLGIKSVGGTGHVKVYAADGTVALDMDVKTATDMYYDITSMDGKTMIIASSGSAIISLTNIKVTYKVSETTTVSDDDGLAAASYAASTASGPKARTPISTDSNVVTTVTTSVVSLADTTEQTYLLSVNAESVTAALATLVVEEEPEVEEPEEPEVPETPEEPEEPEVPEEPEAPEKPGKPGNPGNPGKPGKPGKPGRPELEQPQKPGKDHDKKDDKFHKYDSKVNRKHD